jgi:TatD DNase family protein
MSSFIGEGPRGEVLVDFDANLLHDALKGDIDEHISVAGEHANVQYFVVPGSGLGDSADALSLSKSRGESIIATAGVHPYHAKDENDIHSEANEEVLRSLCAEETCKAVGETGLDYSEGFPDKEAQIPWFRFQVGLALEKKLPLFLHIRDAKNDFLSIMNELGFPEEGPPPVRACVHCFTGDTEELKQYVNMGFYIGLTGYIFNMNDSVKLKEWLDIIPANRLVLETDAPYLGWAGCRATEKKKKKSKYPNVPASLSIICQEVASISGRSYDEVASSTTRNALEFFGSEGQKKE